jgi:acetylornithine deacetylase/succinyl-diaminopimelate desuccinylase-like protein
MFGRDVEDVKFDVAAVIVTLKRLKTEGFKPATDNVLVLSGDEETASARYS